MGENLFEEELTVEALSEMGNPLERLLGKVDFEMFRPVLEDALLTKEVKSAAGRKPIDVVLMFKVIFLQRYYGLGDHQIQYQIIDRTTTFALRQKSASSSAFTPWMKFLTRRLCGHAGTVCQRTVLSTVCLTSSARTWTRSACRSTRVRL